MSDPTRGGNGKKDRVNTRVLPDATRVATRKFESDSTLESKRKAAYDAHDKLIGPPMRGTLGQHIQARHNADKAYEDKLEARNRNEAVDRMLRGGKK